MRKGSYRKWIYGFVCMTVGRAVCAYMNYSPREICTLKGPFVVVSNHNGDLDPVFLGRSFSQQLTFVASEHVLRKGWLSAVLEWCFSIIARRKGSTDAKSALDILRALRNGDNVCIFGEGNRSFNGVTGPVFPATGKLARASRATLVTFRLSGDYLKTPRWAKHRRRGRIFGRVVGVYTPEQLKAMTDDEVNAVIARDIREDAWEDQRQSGRLYPGKDLAEGIEYAAYLCPNCMGISTVYGAGDHVKCRSCDLDLLYTDKGTFTGERVPFENLRDWDVWQRSAFVKQLSGLSPEEPVFTDQQQSLKRLKEDHTMEELAAGTLTMTRRTLSVGEQRFLLSDISDMAVCGRGKLVFSAGTEQYEISAEKNCAAGRKYEILYRIERETAAAQPSEQA